MAHGLEYRCGIPGVQRGMVFWSRCVRAQPQALACRGGISGTRTIRSLCATRHRQGRLGEEKCEYKHEQDAHLRPQHLLRGPAPLDCVGGLRHVRTSGRDIRWPVCGGTVGVRD